MEVNEVSLRSLRLCKGLTVSALAGKAGIKQPHLSNIEEGRRRPSDGLIMSLAVALNEPLQAIVIGRLPKAS